MLIVLVSSPCILKLFLQHRQKSSSSTSVVTNLFKLKIPDLGVGESKIYLLKHWEKKMAGGRAGGRAELEPERGREQGAREGEVMLLQNFFFFYSFRELLGSLKDRPVDRDRRVGDHCSTSSSVHRLTYVTYYVALIGCRSIQLSEEAFFFLVRLKHAP